MATRLCRAAAADPSFSFFHFLLTPLILFFYSILFSPVTTSISAGATTAALLYIGVEARGEGSKGVLLPAAACLLLLHQTLILLSLVVWRFTV